MENRWEMGGESGPRYVKSELPRSWVEGCVVQLCEAQGFMDEGRVVMIPWAMCTGVSCQSKVGSLGW